MFVLALIPSALAAPPAGARELTTGNGCVVWREPATADGITPVYAECTWPDVEPAKLYAVLGDWEGHARVHQTVVSSAVRKTEGDRSLVYQEHQLSGVSTREVEIWMWKAPLPEGGFAFAWESTAPVTPKKGNVATAHHEGYWHVSPAPAGGSRVTYRLAYDAGGSVPGFLVRWFQGSGTLTTTEELRAAGR